MRKLLSFALLFALMIGIVGCTRVAPEEAIVGTWKSRSTDAGIVTEITYVFRSDGTGECAGVFSTAFTYTISGNALHLTTSVMGFQSTETYSCSFKGAKLILTGSNETITLEKVE